MSPQRKATGKRSKRNKAAVGPQPTELKPLGTRVAGIDLASQEHWVCCPAHSDGKANVRKFGTTTTELKKIAEWLQAEGIDSVAMESTSVYWIPLYELLDSLGFEVVLVNARQLRHVPGRKTDMQDCQWLHLLHSCGLLRGSFRPRDEICGLRALQRECAELVQQRSQAVQKMQKALDQMNVQVHRAVTDITGVTGMAIVRAIVAGEHDPLKLAQLRDRRCAKSKTKIAEHLTGNWRREHLFNLEMALKLYDYLQEMIGSYEAKSIEMLEALQPPERVDESLPQHPNKTKDKAIAKRGEQPLRTALWLFAGVDLTRIDGISTGSAVVALTEVGADVTAFPSEHHFVSWLGLSPKTSFSAGKPLKKKHKGTGATRLASVLRMAALSLKNSPTALGAAFRRIGWRKGIDVAVFATARKLATLIYRMLRYGQDYVDEGAEAYEKRFEHNRLVRLKKTAEELGYQLVSTENVAEVSG